MACFQGAAPNAQRHQSYDLAEAETGIFSLCDRFPPNNPAGDRAGDFRSAGACG
jgi:hypothetical protein